MPGFYAVSAHKRQMIISLGLTVLAAASIVYLHFGQFWQSQFFEDGAELRLYQVCRIFFAVLCLLWPWALGHRMLSSNAKFKALAPSSVAIHSFFIGAATLNLFGSLLAHAGILFWPILFVASVLLTALIPFALDRAVQDFMVWLRSRRPRTEYAAILLILVSQIFYLLVAKGLAPDFPEGDTLGHYLPYLQSVSDSGSLGWPTEFYFNFFFLKGAGFILFPTSLTDIQSVQLVSFAFFVICGLMLKTWLSLLFKNGERLALALVVVYFASPSLLAIEFQKLHMMSGAFVLYLLFALYQPISKNWLLYVGVSFALLNPTYTVFVAIFILINSVTALFSRQKKQFVNMIWLASAVGLAVVGLLVTNYLWTGVAEVTPFSAALKLSDPRYRPAGILLWHIRYFIIDEGRLEPALYSMNLWDHANQVWLYLTDDQLSSWRKPIVNLIAASAIFIGLIVVIMRNQKKSGFTQVAATVTGILIVIYLLKNLVIQTSFHRGLSFVPAMRVTLIGLTVYGLWSFASRSNFARLSQLFIVFALLASAAHGLVIAHSKGITRGLRFGLGYQSYADFYGIKPNHPCVLARNQIPDSERLTLLHIHPSCVGNPASRVDYIDPFRFTYEGKPLYMSPAEEARAGFEKLGVKNFLFVPQWDMYFFAAMPVFQPDFVQKNFKILKVLENAIVLTWRGPGDPELPPEFMQIYRNNITHPVHDVPKQFFNLWVKKRNEGQR